MNQSKQRKFNLKSKLSYVTSEASTNTDLTSSIQLPTKKFNFDSQQELNLSKLCLSKRKSQPQRGEVTSRSLADHVEIASSIAKRFQRKTDQDDPFLRTKLKHIVKNWPNQHQETEQIIHSQPLQKWLQQPKFVSLRMISKENAKKQVEIKNISRKHVELY